MYVFCLTSIRLSLMDEIKDFNQVEVMYRTLMVAYFKKLRHHDYYYRMILEREGMINYNCSPQHGTFYAKPLRHTTNILPCFISSCATSAEPYIRTIMVWHVTRGRTKKERAEILETALAVVNMLYNSFIHYCRKYPNDLITIHLKCEVIPIEN